MSAVAACCPDSAPLAPSPVYQPRRPERTVAYQAVQGHLETWLRLARSSEPDGDPILAHVEREFRQYLSCGILTHGFARARCVDCGHDCLVAFSCKGRGVCSSCSTRRMAETAAHQVDHVFPEVPVRQWVLSLPKWLRYFLQRQSSLVNPVLGIFLAEVETALRACSPDAPNGARFGSTLNANLHFHCCVIDGLFSAEAEGLRFHPACLSEAAIARVQQQTRRRVLKRFERRAVLPEDATELMLGLDHSEGFSLHAEVWVAPWDRAGLERLLRYCARLIFASERLAWVAPDERLIYHLPKTRPDGQTVLILTPLEFLDRLATLVPPPRKHRHRYHGVLAPHSPPRLAIMAYVDLPLDGPAPPATPPAKPSAEPKRPSPAAYLWAVLLARAYAVLPLICPECGRPMQLIAAVTEREPVQRILRHIGEPALPPPILPARSPPEAEAFDWEQTAGEARGQGERLFEPPPEFQFDQTVSW